MSAPFNSVNRALAPDHDQSSSLPIDAERSNQFASSTQFEAWNTVPTPPDEPGMDADIAKAQAVPTPAQPTQAQEPQQPPPQASEPQPQSPPAAGTESNQPRNDLPDPASISYKPQKEEVLFQWQSPSRPYKQHSKQYYSTILIIAILVSTILFFANQLVFVAVIAALVFLSYVLMTTPPSTITQQLTTYGIRVENNLYYWEELGRFWFSKKFGQDLLHIEVDRFPNRITMLLGDIKKDDMHAVLSEVLLDEEPPPTFYEKAAAWLQEKLPLEIEQ